MSNLIKEDIRMRIKPINLGGLQYVFKNMRARDVSEMEMLGVEVVDSLYYSFMHTGVVGQLVYVGDTPVSFLVLLKNGPRSVEASMLATNTFNDIGAEYTRYCVKVLKPLLLSKGYNRVECRTWEGHIDSRRWLRWLGAKPELELPFYGLNGETFVQYGWNADVCRSKQG